MTFADELASNPLRVADTVRLRTDHWYSGMEFMPTEWQSAGEGAEVARVIAITDYHYITPKGYSGVNHGDVSRKVNVLFPNGAELKMHWVDQFEIIPNGDPLS
jgi:hypothetical protein